MKKTCFFYYHIKDLNYTDFNYTDFFVIRQHIKKLTFFFRTFALAYFSQCVAVP